MENKTKHITFEELATSNMFQLEALYRLLMNKGLITEKEFLDELQTIKQEYDRENK